MKSVLQPSKESLVIRKIELLQILKGPGRIEIRRPGRKIIIKERPDIEQEILELDAAIAERDDFELKLKRGVPLTHSQHFYWAYQAVIEKISKRPKRIKAAHASVKKRKKKAETWKNTFIDYRKKYKSAHQKLDRVITDSEIIKHFIQRNKKAPRNKSTYYSYLKK